jgi:hypothetical protein
MVTVRVLAVPGTVNAVTLGFVVSGSAGVVKVKSPETASRSEAFLDRT